MRRWIDSWKRLPRSIRSIANLFAIMVLVFFTYISIGSPAFTPEQQFRREEKAHLVEPAMLLGAVSLENFTGYEDQILLLGTNKDGVTLFTYHDDNLEFNKFIYRHKMGDATVLSIPNIWIESRIRKRSYIEIPVVVFDSFPSAVRAELQIELYSRNTSESFREKYTLSANRTVDGYFIFTLSVSNPEKKYGIVDAIRRFVNVCDDDLITAFTGVEIPATVKFYDQQDFLVNECSVIIRHPANEIET